MRGIIRQGFTVQNSQECWLVVLAIRDFPLFNFRRRRTQTCGEECPHSARGYSSIDLMNWYQRTLHQPSCRNSGKPPFLPGAEITSGTFGCARCYKHATQQK
jgi:hypothetical protein